MLTDNPARRLQNIINSLLEAKGDTLNEQGRAQILFHKALNASSSSQAFSKMAEFDTLPAKIDSLLDKHHPDFLAANDYLQERCTTLVSQYFNNAEVVHVIKTIDSHFLTYLRMVASVLDSNTGETLGNQSVKEISKILDEAIELATNADDLSEDMKLYLVRHLQKVQVHLRDYQISGTEPIVESIEVIFGHAAMDSEFRATLKEVKDGTLNKTLTKVAEVSTIIAAATGVYQITPSVVGLLTSS